MSLGDRYLMGNYEGTMMDKPFHGMSCSGYDNVKKVYFSGWIDDMSTGMMAADKQDQFMKKFEIIMIARE